MNYNTLDPKKTLSLDLKLEETTIAWIAGLLEGEATFRNDGRNRKKNIKATPPTPYVKLRMTDQDVVQKFADCVKKNVIVLPPPGDLEKNLYILVM